LSELKLAPCWWDFCTFAKAQIQSGDLDPTYPVLKRLYAADALPREIALWRTLLYVTWYNLHSAEVAWTRFPEPGELPSDLRLPTGTERRGFRGNDLAAQHVNTLLAQVRLAGGKLTDWVEGSMVLRGKRGWAHMRQRFQSIPYGGNWSSYKWADMMKNVHGYDITASDIGVGGGGATAGPVPGMVRLTGASWRVVATDVALQQGVHDRAVADGVPFNGLDMLETACCDFNSLCKGSYYVGHDIDVQQEYLASCSDALKRARLNSFVAKYLGELKTVYLDTGKVLT